VGRRRWTDPMVIRDRNILLGSDRTAFEALIEAWRKNAVVRFKEAWEVMVAEEIRSFGYKSFFARQRGDPAALAFDGAMDDEDPDQNEEVASSEEEPRPSTSRTRGQKRSAAEDMAGPQRRRARD